MLLGFATTGSHSEPESNMYGIRFTLIRARFPLVYAPSANRLWIQSRGLRIPVADWKSWMNLGCRLGIWVDIQLQIIICDWNLDPHANPNPLDWIDLNEHKYVSLGNRIATSIWTRSLKPLFQIFPGFMIEPELIIKICQSLNYILANI